MGGVKTGALDYKPKRKTMKRLGSESISALVRIKGGAPCKKLWELKSIKQF